MDSWQTVALAEVATVVSGATPKTGEATYWDGEIPWATPRDLSTLEGPYISSTPRQLTKAGLASCGATILPRGSVLFSSRAPIGHVAINTVEMATNQGFKSLVPKSESVDANYLYHWLRANRQYLQSLGNGATFKEVSKTVMSRVRLPVPPIDEQRRIATILDRADALRTRRKHAFDRLDELDRRLFNEHLRDESVALRPLAELATLYAGGTLPSGGPFRNDNGGYLLLKVSDMNAPGNEKLIRSAARWTAVPASKSATVPPGTIVIPKRGGAIATNKKRVVDRPAILDPNLMGITPLERSVESTWLYHWFEQFDLTSITSGSSVPQLNKKDLLPLSVEVPSRSVQRRFSAQVARSNVIRQRSADSLHEISSLFASLQVRAFSGRL